MQLASQSNGLLNALNGKLSGPASLAINIHLEGLNQLKDFQAPSLHRDLPLARLPPLSHVDDVKFGYRTSGHRAKGAGRAVWMPLLNGAN